jgi:hypothetical protein
VRVDLNVSGLVDVLGDVTSGDNMLNGDWCAVFCEHRLQVEVRDAML